MNQKIITGLVAAIMITSVIAPITGVAGAQESAPPGMVGVPSDNVGPPDQANGNGQGGPSGKVSIPSAVPTHAAAWSVHSSDHAGDLEVTIGERDGELVLRLTDDANHDGRDVAVDASALEEAVGERPEIAYGLHENGSEWTSQIRYSDGYAIWSVPHFSTNDVTFTGSIEIRGNPASDGSQYQYNLSDSETANNFTVELTGRENTGWSNESAEDLGPSSTQSISPAGNADPYGPGANGNPTVSVTLPVSEIEASTADSLISGSSDIEVVNGYAYVTGQHDDSLVIFDVSDPTNPSKVGSVSGSKLNHPMDVEVDGNYAYVAARDYEGFAVVDISDRTAPSVAAAVQDLSDLDAAQNLEVDGNYLYVTATSSDTFVSYDISTPSSPSKLNTLSGTDLNTPRGFDISGNYAFVSQGTINQTTVVDISSPSSLSVAGSVASDTELWDVADVEVEGNYAWVTSRRDRVTTLDISSPTSPTIAGSVADSRLSGAKEVDINQSIAYVGGAWTANVTMFDTSSPSSPSVYGSIESPSLDGTIGIDVANGWVFASPANDPDIHTLDEAQQTALSSVSVDDGNGNSASIGTVNPGETVTEELAIDVSATSLSWSGSGPAEMDVDVRLEERTVTEDATIEINGDAYQHSGVLSPGSTTTLDVSTASLQNGTNTVAVGVSQSYSGPTGLVGLDYRHEAVDKQSVDYGSEAFTERYNVSKAFAEDQSNATLTIPFEQTVVAMRALETRTNGGTWSTVASSDYELDGTTLTVQLGDVAAGDEIEVRAVGSKVQVQNGEITVTDATELGKDLASEIRIDSYSDGFEIAVNETAYANETHYTYSESWSNPQSHVRVETDGDQFLRLPQAGAGGTARIGTIDMEIKPSGGPADVRVVDAGAEPKFNVRDSTTVTGIEFVWRNTVSGHTYQLYSLSAEEERDRADAQSPVSLTHDGTAETLIIYDLDSSGSSSAEGPGVGGPTSTSSLDSVIVIGAAVGALILMFIVTRRFGSGISGMAMFGAGSLIVGILAIQALAPEVLAEYIGMALSDAFPLLLVAAAAIAIYWLRSRQDNVTIDLGGRR